MTTEQLLEKINLCADKLIHLGGADYEADKKIDLKDAIKTGNIARDFGIEEWDWPQGVGLYGLLRLQDYYGDDRFLSFYEDWYRKNLEIGLPSSNINTTAPFLPLVSLLDRLSDKERLEKLCVERADWLMKDLPKTTDNGFQHVTSAIGDRNGVTLHDGELWMDTLFMAVLFLQKMGNRYQKSEWQQEA
ncbi:MAG: glycoside hydrolase family 88 protein, partial [Lachnospiraceae bacterium]|nr:glycoside hydrolase family 88 protein [Lachnospiraceae bacterium]